MFIVIQGGTKLYRLGRNGVLSELTLPPGVTLSDQVPPRFCYDDRKVVMVNSPSKPIVIDEQGTIWPLTLESPSDRPTLSGVTAGALTGAYRAKYTNVLTDESGNILSQSDYGAESAQVSITSKKLRLSDLQLSSETISARRLYRTTTSGAVYFQWMDLDGNVETSVEDDLSDAGLQLAAAPTLGAAPDLMLVANHRGRLWGVPRLDGDAVRYAEAGARYAWPSDNRIEIPGGGIGSEGLSSRGIVSFLKRREALAVARGHGINEIAGLDSTEFRPITIHDEIGVISHESGATWNDVSIFLADDGVYKWDASGLSSLTDGDDKRGKVRAWFTTDDFFNRALFARAFGHINHRRKVYQLYLCGAGFPYITHWVEMDLRTGRWFGPHTTSVFEPTCSAVLSDDNEVFIPLIGGRDGYVWREHLDAYDNVSTGIEFDVEGKTHDDGDPDLDHYFGEMSILGKKQDSSSTMTITPRLGYENDVVDGAAIAYNMRNGRQRLRRIGTAKTMQLRFQHSTASRPVELYGYRIPTHVLGRR